MPREPSAEHAQQSPDPSRSYLTMFRRLLGWFSAIGCWFAVAMTSRDVVIVQDPRAFVEFYRTPSLADDLVMVAVYVLASVWLLRPYLKRRAVLVWIAVGALTAVAAGIGVAMSVKA